jgi:AraC-like DNA-binding protein
MQTMEVAPEDLKQRTSPLRLLPNGPRIESLAIPTAHRHATSFLPTYREVAPPIHLREHVVCFWRRPGGARTNDTQVLPDGCIDVIWAGESPPNVAGPMTLPLKSTISAGAEIIGVRFRPGVAPALLGVSAQELLNQHVSLSDIWSRKHVLPWSDAADRAHFPAKLEAIVTVIAHRLGAVAQPDVFVTDATRWIADHPSGNLEQLIRLSGLSERQVRRRFDEAIGYGPKKLQRILRLQRLLWLAGQRLAVPLNLADLAFAAGYADQPHMTREVAALSGASPGTLLRGTVSSAVSDLFKTPTP